MNRYLVNKVLWTVYRQDEDAHAFLDDPNAYLAPYDLTEGERSLLARRDLRGLLSDGAHPFLLYNFALRLEGQWSMPFLHAYVDQIRGLDVGDVTT